MPVEEGKMSGKGGAVSVKNPVFMLAVSTLLCFIGALGAGLIKSNGVAVKALRWETPSGRMLAGRLFIPKNAGKDAPAPAIVCAHSWMLNGEYQDEVYIEFSRRGYVVLSIDMYGHGYSDNVANNDWWKEEGGANGLYDGVRMLASLPFVDASKIGVTGNSNGATACNLAVMLDNEAAEPLIASVLLVVNEPIVSKNQELIGAINEESDNQYYNLYGNRDVGLVSAGYDEIFNRLKLRDGTITPPRDFIDQPAAQSFLNFGRDPAGLEKRDSYTMYRENINAGDAVRIIYNPAMIHLWSFFSSRVVSYSVEFFQQSIPAPNPIRPAGQIWQWKVFFSAAGIVGLLMFLVNFILAMLKTRFFAALKAQEPPPPIEAARKGKIRLWVRLSAPAVFAAISYPVIFVLGVLYQPKFFNQQQTYVLGLWLLCCGLFTLLALFLNYRGYSKANGLDPRERGLILSRDKIWKTVLLGVLAAVATYTIVFLIDYFFNTDFHVWVLLGFNAFDARRFVEILKFFPFFLFFFAVNSVAVNVFNFIRIGKKEWINTLLLAVFNTLGVVLLFVGGSNTPPLGAV